jgi:transposase-like protein
MEKQQASSERTEMESEETRRLALYRRDDVRRLIDQLLKENGSIEPRRDRNTGDYAFDEVTGLNLSVLLKELSANGVLDEYRIDSVPTCPKCESSSFFVNYSCPFCQHHNINRATMLEHYGCGHIDFESNFKSGRDLVCPKCSRELKLIGTDFRRMDRVYHCSSCNRNFGTPNVQLSCRKCEAVFLLDDAHTIPILGYRLNEKLRGELVAHCALEAPIVAVLRGLGYEVEAPFLERGVSGIDHTFDIYAHNAHSGVVLSIASGTQEVGQESVFALFAKIYDTKHDRAILVAMPRLSREAQQLSANFKIEVVDGASLEALVGHLKESATIVQMDLPLGTNPLGTTPLAGPSHLDPFVVDAEASMLSLSKQMAVLLQRASAEEAS